jgi:hypothetical protein
MSRYLLGGGAGFGTLSSSTMMSSTFCMPARFSSPAFGIACACVISRSYVFCEESWSLFSLSLRILIASSLFAGS